MRKEPSRPLIAALLAAVAMLVFGTAGAQAASLHVVFPQSVEVTVVQGQSTDFTMETQAYGAIPCDATTGPLRIDSLYSLNAGAEIAAGVPIDMPIQTAQNRGSSDNCYIQNPVVVPLTATAAAETPVGDYTSVIRYGQGGDGGIDLDGPPLTIHVIAPDQPALPPPAIVAPPEIIVLGVREAPRPTLGKTLLIAHVKGSVIYKVTGQGAKTLTGSQIVPNGTIVDATHGVVKVTVVRDATGVLDSADAWQGSFKAIQTGPKNGVRALTTFTLEDPITGSQTGASAARVNAHQSRSSRKRSLWVNAKGNFKTRGKRASAIIRGTYWHTEDTGSTTRVTVKRGLVAVRDFTTKHTVLVSTGHSYTAKVRTHTARRVPAFTGSLPRH